MTVTATADTALPRPARRALARPRSAAWGRLFLVCVFIFGLVLPVEASIYVGPLRLSVYRVVLLIALVPCAYRLLTGAAGRLVLADYMIVGHALWAFMALMIIHGIGGSAALPGSVAVGQVWQFAGIYLIEATVPYLLARCFIRNADDYEAVIRVLAVVIGVLALIAAYKSLSGHILRNPPSRPDPRLGLERAYGPFDHPILLGTFCSSILGMVLFGLKGRVSKLGRWARVGAILVATFFSLSSGPLSSAVVQMMFAVWNKVTRRIAHRWMILAGIAIAAWVTVSMLSTRTPIHVFITYFTFNIGTAYNRILIWDFGTAEVGRHPILGIELNDWVRPEWMHPSLDNFWLLTAMRYGMPAFLMLAGGTILLMTQVGRRKNIDLRTANCRTGWLITMMEIIVTGATVDYWNALFAFVMFLIGAGAWMAKAPQVVRAPVRQQPRVVVHPAASTAGN